MYPMKHGYQEHLIDLLAPWGKVTTRRMFGVYALYRDGRIFGLVTQDAVYFKVGDANCPDYAAAGSAPLVYSAKGKEVALPYWLVPTEMLEDQELLTQWAQKAYEMVLAAKGKPKTPKAKPRQWPAGQSRKHSI
jgi:DNA transformation protein